MAHRRRQYREFSLHLRSADSTYPATTYYQLTTRDVREQNFRTKSLPFQ